MQCLHVMSNFLQLICMHETSSVGFVQHSMTQYNFFLSKIATKIASIANETYFEPNKPFDKYFSVCFLYLWRESMSFYKCNQKTAIHKTFSNK